MPRPSTPRPAGRIADLRGAVRLAADATAGLTDLVEAMHERIGRLPGLPAAAPEGRTRGITGLVYKTIRGVTRVVGGSVDALLGLLTPALAAAPGQAGGAGPNSQREAIVAALNGVLGDHLATTNNPLATPMTLRRDGQPLQLDRAALLKRFPAPGSHLLVLVHGLCMNDLQWQRDGHDLGATLARTLGFTPLYLHYNSGLHVSSNGAALADLLERLLDAWPHPRERLTLLCHSMGGLVARSAIHQARHAARRWPEWLDDLVFLGTPHHGAPLERAGNGLDIVLGATPYAAPFARLGKVRSAGVTDLRHGFLVESDWAGRDRFARGAKHRTHVPLPDGVRCFSSAATISRAPDGVGARLLGDGLVPLRSALGLHTDTARCLAFEPPHQWVGHGMNHLDLLNHAEVDAQLLRWLESAPSNRTRKHHKQ